MGDKVKFYRSTSNKIAQHPIENGALYFATDKPESYMDIGGERVTIYEPHSSWSFEEMKPEGPPQARNDCLIFWEENGQNFTFQMSAKNWNGTLEVSTDGNTWILYTDISTIVSSVNSKLYLRGSDINKFSSNNLSSNASKIQLSPDTARIKCIGNIETLLDWQTVVNGEHPIMDNYCFCGLFYNCFSLVQAPSLPMTTLTGFCFSQMFYNCISLVQAPSLPAMTLSSYCYNGMFYGCTSLTQIPSLPAITLASNCYTRMFGRCTKIKFSTEQTGEYQTPYRIPVAGTGITAANATKYMFSNTGGTFKSDPTINTTYYTSNEIV